MRGKGTTFSRKSVIFAIELGSMSKDERQLIDALRNGEDWAYAEIFERYYEGMCVLANSLLHDSFLAEATAQDVISHLYEVRADLSIRTNLRSYLYTSVRNFCLNALGTKKARTEQTFSSLGPAAEGEGFGDRDHVTPQGRLLDRELQFLVNEFVDNLPEPTRTTFIRSRWEGKSYREIGAEMGVSANTIKFRIKNVLTLFEERFAQYLTKGLILVPLLQTITMFT